MAVKKTTIKAANKALKKLSDKKLNDINQTIFDSNKSELVDFTLRFSNHKDFKHMVSLLAALQERPQFLKKENEFETLYGVGIVDGQAYLLQSFMEVMVRAMQGDTEFIQQKLNPIIVK